MIPAPGAHLVVGQADLGEMPVRMQAATSGAIP